MNKEYVERVFRIVRCAAQEISKAKNLTEGQRHEIELQLIKGGMIDPVLFPNDIPEECLVKFFFDLADRLYRRRPDSGDDLDNIHLAFFHDVRQ